MLVPDPEGPTMSDSEPDDLPDVSKALIFSILEEDADFFLPSWRCSAGWSAELPC
jgi:hypothetical protein